MSSTRFPIEVTRYAAIAETAAMAWLSDRFEQQPQREYSTTQVMVAHPGEDGGCEYVADFEWARCMSHFQVRPHDDSAQLCIQITSAELVQWTGDDDAILVAVACIQADKWRSILEDRVKAGTEVAPGIVLEHSGPRSVRLSVRINPILDPTGEVRAMLTIRLRKKKLLASSLSLGLDATAHARAVDNLNAWARRGFVGSGSPAGAGAGAGAPAVAAVADADKGHVGSG